MYYISREDYADRVRLLAEYGLVEEEEVEDILKIVNFPKNVICVDFIDGLVIY